MLKDRIYNKQKEIKFFDNQDVYFNHAEFLSDIWIIPAQI